MPRPLATGLYENVLTRLLEGDVAGLGDRHADTAPLDESDSHL